jgi:GT2 family glycosyltransferase
VDNGSEDGSVELLEKSYPEVRIVRHNKNLGFAGGVNAGIRLAMEKRADFVALLNNDAVADKDWLKRLAEFLTDHPEAGIVTSKILESDGKMLDSTGDIYTSWGLPYPRGRDETDNKQYDKDIWIFAASGGASLYRVKMLKQIGLFEEDFFAYYEDVDISFRAQLAGWKVGYEPAAIALHQISATSSQIKGFATYHTLKNLPLLLWKNVPWKLMPTIWPRLALIYAGIAARALARGYFTAFIKGIFMGTILWPKKLVERNRIQKNRKVSVDYIKSMITYDLPPNARTWRSVRRKLGGVS